MATSIPAVRLQTGWFGTDLGEYRPCDGTYELYPAESLPPLPADGFGTGFGWLRSADAVNGECMQPAKLPPHLAAPLPPAFEQFMQSPELQSAVPSCTACYWDVSGKVVPGPFDDGATLLRFLNDQQSCVHWYLYLEPDGSHRVVAGGGYYDDPYPAARADMRQDLIVVAPDFERFVYRFWVENVAWYEAVEEEREWDALSGPVVDYLTHYREEFSRGD